MKQEIEINSLDELLNFVSSIVENLSSAEGPRITSELIENSIVEEYFFTLNEVTGNDSSHPFSRVTLCVLRLDNDFTIIGKSACISPENFNYELGCEYARKDAVRQIWPLMGFALAEKLKNQ